MACAGMCRRGRLHPDSPGRSHGRAGKARFRRLPRLSGRRSGRAAGCLRARAGAARAGPHPGSGSATAGSGFVAAASPAGSGATSVRSPRKRPRRSWWTAWRSAHSKGPTPSGWFLATGSCSMAGPWNSVAATDWSSTPEQEGPSRDCRSGTAIASRSRPSWPARSPSSGPREPGGSPGVGRWPCEPG